MFGRNIKSNCACTDYVQELFDPVQFSDINKDTKEAVYMQLSRLLNEAEGIYTASNALFHSTFTTK